MKREGLLLMGLLMLTLTTGCVGRIVYTSGPYQGRVVDAGTKTPLAGVAVLLVLRKQVPVGAHMPDVFVDAVEVLTDANGDFTVPQQTQVILFGWMLEPNFVIYYPGYASYPSLQAWPQGEDVTAAFERKVFNVELSKLKTREERMRNAGLPVYAGGVPEAKMPNLMRLVNIELRELGLQPIGGWKEPM